MKKPLKLLLQGFEGFFAIGSNDAHSPGSALPGNNRANNRQVNDLGHRVHDQSRFI